MIIMKVIVDSRETKERKKKAEEIFDKVEIKQLEYGDYVCGNCGVEFKTVDDFIGSVKSKRIFKQAIGLKDNYQNHYIIVYGDMSEAIEKTMYIGHYFGVNQYLGSLASLVQITNVLQVKNLSQAFKLTKFLFDKCNDGRNRDIAISNEQKKEKNKIISVLMLIGSVNSKRAETMVKELNINTMEDLINIDPNQILKLKGFGEKTVNSITKWLK